MNYMFVIFKPNIYTEIDIYIVRFFASLS